MTQSPVPAVPSASAVSAAPTQPGSGVPIVVLVSGSGTLLQALIDATSDATNNAAYGVRIVAVGADRDGIAGLDRAAKAGIPTFVCRTRDYADRAAWDAALAATIASFGPRFVVSAGFMKLFGPATLALAPILNTHPALLPSFPGAHGVRDALAYGVKVTGTTAHLVDAGIDSGPIIEQRVVAVEPGDTEESLHERIKVAERSMIVDVVMAMATRGYTVDGRQVRLGASLG